MLSWHEIEDQKYSALYQAGYPIGDPMGVVNAFSYSPDLFVCDLGCGRASLANYFSRYVGVDIAQFIIDENTKKRSGTYHHASLHNLACVKQSAFDLVICADVLEHIPPDQISAVLKEISTLTAVFFAFAISTRKSVFLDQDGGNLHLTVWSHDQWCDELDQHFEIVQRIDRSNLLVVELTNE